MRGSREGSRIAASVILAALAGVLVLAGTLAFYVRSEVLDADAFADRAVAALEDDAVRQVVAAELTVQLVERGAPNLLAARPVVEPVIGTVIGSRPFEKLFREAALRAHRLLFDRDRKAVDFDLSDSVEVIRFALGSVAPDLADDLPADIDGTVLALERREFAKQTLDVAEVARPIGLIAPVLALLALTGSILAAPDRRVGVLRAAVAVGAAGTLLAAGLLILRERLLAGVVGSDELSDAELRDAVGGLLDALLGGLLVWGLILALVGVAVAGAAAVLDPHRGADPMGEMRRRLLQRPSSTPARVARGVAAIVAGLIIALLPELSLRIAGLVLGAYLVFLGSGELLLLLQRRDADPNAARASRKRTLALAAGTAGVVVIAAVAAILVLTDDDDGGGGRAAVAASGCNGSPELCPLRLNEVVFAGTHNSFSAADTPGWFIANQRHDIARQLEDGIRLFLIDPHWGAKSSKGAVLTDFEREGRDRNKVAAALPLQTLAAAQRLAGDFGLGSAAGESEVWLCHTTCELGATKFSDALDEYREFLEANPGEVVVLFIEPYVPPSEIEAAVEAAGLADYLATLDRSAPLPTLGELVDSNRRLVVFTEKDADGTVPWYLDGFSFIQDTPLGVTKPEDLVCDRERGDADSPILMLNQWADVFPPQRGANPPFQTMEEILGRAHRCERERGLPVGFIAVDHYDLGDLIPAVAELNEERVAARREAVR